MKKNNQTAIEWLIENLHIAKDPFAQAKAIEKKQISKAWDDGNYAYFYSKKTGKDFKNGIEYYNEIFKQLNKKT